MKVIAIAFIIGCVFIGWFLSAFHWAMERDWSLGACFAAAFSLPVLVCLAIVVFA